MKFSKPIQIGEPISLEKAVKDVIATPGGLPLHFHVAFYQRVTEHLYLVISVLFYPRIRIRYIFHHEPLPIEYIDSLAFESGLI